MTEFKNRALGALQRIYGFLGGVVTTSRADLEGQIQLVHDVSREAEVAAGVGGRIITPGWWWLRDVHVHAGADTVLSSLNPYNAINTEQANLPEFDLWLYDVGVWSVIDGRVSSANAVLWRLTPYPGGTVRVPQLLFVAAAAVSVANVTAAGTDSMGLPTAGVAPAMPLLIPENSIINSVSVSSGADDFYMCYLVYAAPRGVLPPGMA